MSARLSWLVPLVMLASALALAGCSSSTASPNSTVAAVPGATELLARSATAMQAVTSAHFALTVDGQLPDLKVQGAEGDLTSTGDGQGQAKINQLGQLVQVEFVFLNTDLYLKGPTGGFTKLPAAMAGQIYDPTGILNADQGVAKVLSSVTAPGTPAAAGSSFTVTGTVPKAVAAALVPGIADDVTATFTVDQATSQLTSIGFALTGSDGKPGTVGLTLSDFNKAVTITAPA